MAQHPHIGAQPAAEGKVKVVCESCGARYVVRDPRVRGHRFRATCKRCGALILGTATREAPKPSNGDGRISATNDLGGDEDDQWYIIKRGKPKGPYRSAELRQALQTGQLSSKTYVWRSGEADWRRVSEVPALCDGVAETSSPQDESEESTHFHKVAAQQPPEPDPEDEPTRQAPDGDWAMDAEVTRLVRGRHDELSSKVTRLPDPAAWQALPKKERDPIFGSAPGKMGPANIGEPLKRPWAAGEAAGLWAAVPRRPAILPAPSRRHSLAGTGFTGPPQVAPPEAEPVAALLAAAAAAAQQPAAAAAATPQPFAKPALPTLDEKPKALSWVPNPVPLGPVGGKPAAAGPLLLPKLPGFWTPAKISLIVGLPIGLSVVALVVTLLLTRGASPDAAHGQAVSTPPADEQVPIAVKPAAAASPAKERAATRKQSPPAKPESKAAPSREKPETDEVTVAVRTRVKRIGTPRGTPKRRRTRSPSLKAPDPDALLASATRSQRSPRPKRRAAPVKGAVDVDAMLAAGARSARAKRSKKKRPPSYDTGTPMLSRNVDADALLSAGGASSATPRKLSRGQIRSTMAKLRRHVKTCFAQQADAKGIVEIATTVNPDGSASGRAKGRYAGTSAGSCAAQGVSRLRFPRFSGPPMRFSFPFAL